MKQLQALLLSALAVIALGAALLGGAVFLESNTVDRQVSVDITVNDSNATVTIHDLGQYERATVEGPAKTELVATDGRTVHLDDIERGDRIIVTGTYVDHGAYGTVVDRGEHLLADRTVQ